MKNTSLFSTVAISTLALVHLIDVGISPWALLAVRAFFSLPNLVGKWLDVRDRWHRHHPLERRDAPAADQLPVRQHRVSAYVRVRVHLHNPVQHPVRRRLGGLLSAAFDVRDGAVEPAALIVAPALGQDDEPCV